MLQDDGLPRRIERAALSLRVIAGPPGSGRGGEIAAAFAAVLDREPLLVAPTSDDVDRLERDLRGPGRDPRRHDHGFPACSGGGRPRGRNRRGRAMTEISGSGSPAGERGQRACGGWAVPARRATSAPALAALLDDLQAAEPDAARLGGRG